MALEHQLLFLVGLTFAVRVETILHTLYIQEGTIAASHVSASHSNICKSTTTHMHTDRQRVMDHSPSAPLSECNKAFHACSPHLFGP